jgi:hypothetical protein
VFAKVQARSSAAASLVLYQLCREKAAAGNTYSKGFEYIGINNQLLYRRILARLNS